MSKVKFFLLFKKPANRKLARFSPDPSLPREISASNDDFWDSGWSRGHMAPAGNNKHCQQAMNDTFYLSNIVPQVGTFFHFLVELKLRHELIADLLAFTLSLKALGLVFMIPFIYLMSMNEVFYKIILWLISKFGIIFGISK
jgi:hypothetical protein